MSKAKTKSADNVYVGLDVGTTVVRVVVVRKNSSGGVDTIGVGTADSTGLRKGAVVNINATIKDIQSAVLEAERMSGVSIKVACAGIAGSHIKSFNSHGLISVKSGEVTRGDVVRVKESAETVNIPVGFEVLHSLPQQFILDGQGEIKDPVGMNGVRLEVDMHIVAGAVSNVASMMRSCTGAGISIEKLYLEQLAASEAVLLEDEKEIGIGLIDVGGGTTELAVFNRGAVYHTATLQSGGANFTRDLQIGLTTSELEAERVKVEHGCVWMDMVGADAVIDVASVGGRPPRKLAKQVLTQILYSRAEEVFTLILGELQKSGLVDVVKNAGLVITGGVANMEGIVELATSILGVPVRVGRPYNVGGLSDMVSDPAYATAVGLALMHAKKGSSANVIAKAGGNNDNMISSIFNNLRELVGEFF
ncbi:cell division protein FtsA [Deferribacterales bacterium RsTz2092]|nr:cell division protein FtsA [Deferribacterales bacterium]